jgi:hypothetical protein
MRERTSVKLGSMRGTTGKLAMGNKKHRILLSLAAALGAFGTACALALYAPARAPGSVVGKTMCVAGLALIGVGLVRWAYRAGSKSDRE